MRASMHMQVIFRDTLESTREGVDGDCTFRIGGGRCFQSSTKAIEANVREGLQSREVIARSTPSSAMTDHRLYLGFKVSFETALPDQDNEHPACKSEEFEGMAERPDIIEGFGEQEPGEASAKFEVGHAIRVKPQGHEAVFLCQHTDVVP